MGQVRFRRKGGLLTAPKPSDLTVQAINNLTITELQETTIKQLDGKEETI